MEEEWELAEVIRKNKKMNIIGIKEELYNVL
jgi:hypothetical protein